MFVLIQLKPKASFQGFISTSYLGVFEDDGNFLTLEKACAVYEVMVQTKQGMNIETKFLTNSAITNGKLRFKADDPDILFTRVVADDDEIMHGYKDAYESFRLEKIKIQKAQALPMFPNQAGQ